MNDILNSETGGVFADQLRNYFKFVSVCYKLRNSSRENTESFDS
jgi:hypothetical protein